MSALALPWPRRAESGSGTDLMSDRLPVILVGSFRRRFCRAHVDFGLGGDWIVLLMKQVSNHLELRGNKPIQF